MLKQLLIVSSLALAMVCGAVIARAQEAGAKADPPPQAKVDSGVGAKAEGNFEVLTRGPIHEAFASQYQTSAVAGVKVDREPPKPIDEIPPPSRPAGEGVVWIPGYWGWDDATSDFLWVSGTYRNAPPNHRWMPGYWAKVEGGYQWMSGFWLPATMTALNYYSAPPASLERGPSSPPPGQDYFWAPGSYVPSNEKYVWQPGYWVPYQANYVWTPARNVATQAGYVYIPGYWDNRLDLRGTLFAPVRLNAGAAANTNLQLTPSVAIPFNALQFHLFAKANSNTYLFGDYYDQKYAGMGIRPWYDAQYVKGVADPIFGYYDWAYRRSGSDYRKSLIGWNSHFIANAALRPAATLAGQLDLAQTQAGGKNLTQSLLAVPLNNLVSAAPTSFVSLSANEQASIQNSIGDLRLLADNRLKLETSGAGAANVGAAASTVLRAAAQPLNLPRVNVPVVSAVPAAPAELVRGVGQTATGAVQGVQGAVQGAAGAVQGVLPGAAPALPPVLPGILPGQGQGPLPLPRGDDGEGGGLLPLP